MRVSQTGTNPAQGAEVSNTKKTERPDKTQHAKKTDKVAISAGAEGAASEISSKGKEAARIKAAATAAPDVREAKIAELKKRIAEGKYNVKPEAIADRLVDEHISTRGMG